VPKAWRIFQQEAAEDYAAAEKAREQLVFIEQELELYRHPAWPMFVERLTALMEQDTEILMGASLEEIDKVRERIKMVRRTLQIPKDLERRKAELTQEFGLDLKPEGEVSDG
jgi:hypothetical protein